MGDPYSIASTTNVIDATLFSTQVTASQWLPRAHNALYQNSKDIVTQSVNGGSVPAAFSNLGETLLTYNIESIGDRLGNCYLALVLPAVTPGSTATYTRFVDYAALSMIARIELNYNSRNIKTFYPTEMFLNQLKLSRPDFAKFQQYLHGGLTPAQRNTEAASTSRWFIPLWMYWLWFNQQAPLLSGLVNKLQIRVVLNPTGEFVQTDNTTNLSVGITSADLKMDIVTDLDEMRAVMIGQSKDPKGITMLIRDFQFDQPSAVIPAGTTSYTFQPRAINSATATIYCLFRLASLVDTSYSKEPWQLSSAQLPGLFSASSNGSSTLLREQRVEFQTLKEMFDKWSGDKLPIVQYSWAEVPEQPNSASGEVNFGNLSNITFTFTWDTATTADIRLYFGADIANYVQMQGGNLIKMFN